MLIYNYTVRGLKLIGPTIEIPSGQCNTVKLKFDIDNEYKDLRAYAFFIYDNNHYRTVLNDDKEVILPYRLTKEPGKFKLGFVAYEEEDNYLKQRVVTNTINCISYPALHSEEISPDEPINPSEWEQFALHIIDYENPHQTTAEQIGAYTTEEIDNIIEPITNSIEDIYEELDKKEDKHYYDSLEKLNDDEGFLYKINYNHSQLNYDKAKEYFESRFIPIQLGGCSSVRKGNWYGRNYDWYYDFADTYVISLPATENKHSSIGIAALPTGQDISDEIKYQILPFYTLDGINDAGVFCNTNVSQLIDWGKTTGTIPKVEQREKLCLLMVPRYILDNFSSALAAIQYLDNYISLYSTYNDEINFNEEFHFLIGDENSTYIVEFRNNEMIYEDVSNTELKPIITNFSTIGITYNSEGKKIDVDASKDILKLYPNGIERYDIILNDYNNLNSKEAMQTTLQKIKYTNAYSDEQNPIWYSELYANQDGYDITIESSTEIKEQAFEIFQQLYLDRSRDTAKTWQTVSSCVYDIHNRILYLHVQEHFEKEFIFQLEKIDNELSLNSKNSIQNKVITAEFLQQSTAMELLENKFEILQNNLYQLEQRVKRLEEKTI